MLTIRNKVHNVHFQSILLRNDNLPICQINCLYQYYPNSLGRSAANDSLFKLFSYISFSLQKHIPTHLKPKVVQGSVGFVARYRLSNGQSILNLENLDYFD